MQFVSKAKIQYDGYFPPDLCGYAEAYEQTDLMISGLFKQYYDQNIVQSLTQDILNKLLIFQKALFYRLRKRSTDV